MDFILSLDISHRMAGINYMEGSATDSIGSNYLIITDSSRGCRTVQLNRKRWIILGDLIIPSGANKNEDLYIEGLLNSFTLSSLRNIKGTFYLICIDKDNDTIKVFSSILNLLPVYFYSKGSIIFVSSRIDLILKNIKSDFKVNKRYILEKMLFGYTLFDTTQVEGISLLKTNHFLELGKDNLTERQHTDILDLFCEKPASWKKSLDHLSDLFIERAVDYLPLEGYSSSLTGGLDSRTLVAVGLGEGRQISTYSYGGDADSDILIPHQLARRYSLEYTPFILDENYVSNIFPGMYTRSIAEAEGELRISRVHYQMMAMELGSRFDYMVSGNFGSELFRSMRLPGNMISEHVFRIFSNVSDGNLAKEISESDRLSIINKSIFKDELLLLADEIISYRNNFPAGLTSNQRFYHYMLTGVFRKYFGPELIVENKHLFNRTPFIDFTFISELMKSDLAGCNGDFLDNNPARRFRGQALYPAIIRKSFPALLDDRLDRGYRPADLLSPFHLPGLAYQYLRRKLVFRDRSRQPDYSNRVIASVLKSHRNTGIPENYFNSDSLSDWLINDRWRENYVSVTLYLSMYDYLNYLLGEYSNISVKE